MKDIVKISKNNMVPLIGVIAFGIIDRGTSLLQIRPTTLCNMNCIFCSTDSGSISRFHKTDFIVDSDYLIQWLKEIVKVKGKNLHANIDSVGEPTTYPELINLVKEIKKIPNFTRISMQTNGFLLTKKLINNLKKAGLNRINLSIHSLDEEKSKHLFNNKKYNIKKILEIINYIKKSKIELWLTPVFLPNLNDKDIEEIIGLSKKLKVRIGIQKYEIYKYSRKAKRAKKINYYKFYRQLREWERRFKVELIYRNDSTIVKTEELPLVFDKNEKMIAEIVCPGWFENQMIAKAKNRCITINNIKARIKDKINIGIIENKNNIYLAEKI